MFGHHDDHRPGVTAVDEDGNPETPHEAAQDKQKKKKLTYAALGLGAVGVVVTLYVSRRNSAAAAGTPSSAQDVYGLGQLATGAPPPGTGSTAGGGSSSGSDSQYQALAQQLANNNASQLAAANGLRSSIARLVAELHAGAGAGTGDRSVLPNLSSADFAQSLPGTARFDVLGTDTAAGKYSGANVRGGAPVYAFEKVGGVWRWVQGLAPSKAPSGTIFGTPTTFRPYEVGSPVQRGVNVEQFTVGGRYPVANPPHVAAH